MFVTASFAFGGTELTGLAAAEADDPRREILEATREVVWRICIFYIINLFLVGLIVPENSVLYARGGSESRHSPLVIAIELAIIKALPSIFNAMILISMMSVSSLNLPNTYSDLVRALSFCLRQQCSMLT